MVKNDDWMRVEWVGLNAEPALTRLSEGNLNSGTGHVIPELSDSQDWLWPPCVRQLTKKYATTTSL